VDIVLVPIGGGGLISGVSMAIKSIKPSARIIGVESSGAPGMRDSVKAGAVVTLDRVDCIIDGLRVKRVGETTFEVVRQFVDEIVTLPDERIFDAMIWIMSHAKLVVEGAAAAPVAALLDGLVQAPKGSKVVCVLSGGNVNLDQIRGMRWN
jgi:threonine dehydratase